MKILSYEAQAGLKHGLHFSRIKFGRLNLIVGYSATGKTRLLNTIFNGARLVTIKNEFYIGAWDMTFEHAGKTYRWVIETGGNDDYNDDAAKVLKERVSVIENDEEKIVVNRDTETFTFDNKDLPKLSPRESSISILQDEELIHPLYEAMQCIVRRNFSGSDLEVEAGYQAVPQKFLQKVKKTKDKELLFSSGLNLSGKLHVLSLHFKGVYEQICKEFLSIFPFVSQVKLLDAEDFNYSHPGVVPVFALKEKGIDSWIPLKEFSSGMRKVLLILTDIFTLPKEGGVYLIDEYENSLGINAINFFPSILLEADTPSQFILTSHHPYIIGNVPVKDWIILHRKGTEVSVKQGDELEEQFGKSRQQAFIQLINDPFYTEGI